MTFRVKKCYQVEFGWFNLEIMESGESFFGKGRKLSHGLNFSPKMFYASKAMNNALKHHTWILDGIHDSLYGAWGVRSLEMCRRGDINLNI